MRKKKKSLMNNPIESLDCDYELDEEDGLIEGDVDFSKYAVATFSFTNDNNSISKSEEQKQYQAAAVDVPALEHQTSIHTAPESKSKVEEKIPDKLLDNRMHQPYGITPPVDSMDI